MSYSSIAPGIDKNTTLTLLAALIMSFFSGMALAADDNGKKGLLFPAGSAAKNFYGGAGFAGGRTNSPDSNQDGSVTGINTDKSTIGAGLLFGYQINDNVAVQGGYHDFGDDQFSGVSSGGPSWAAGPVSTDHEADGWELGVMGRWPISKRWYALGFIGMLWWESKETYNEGGFISTLTESGSDVTYSLGFEFDHGLKDRIVYRFMGSHHEVGNDGYDINSASAAVIYRFP